MTSTTKKKPSIIKDKVFLGKSLKEPIKPHHIANGTQIVSLAVINKENLGIEEYQRDWDESRSQKIAENFRPDFAVINVCETKYRGRYYYTITDGQHRAKAQPEDSMVCVVTNTITAARQFIVSNDATTTKPVTVDEFFWASLYDKDPDCVFLMEAMEDWDIEPKRHTKKNVKAREFCCMGTLYTVYKQIRRNIRKLNSNSHDNYTPEDCFQLVAWCLFDAYGTNAFYVQAANRWSGFPSVWKAVTRWLGNNGWENRSQLSKVLSSESPGGYDWMSINTPQKLCARASSKYPDHTAIDRSCLIIDEVWADVKKHQKIREAKALLKSEGITT